MQNFKNWFRSGTPWIWLTSGAVSLSLLAVLGLISLLAVRGLGFFWPAEVVQWQVQSESGQSVSFLGEVSSSEEVSVEQLREAGLSLDVNGAKKVTRYLLKTGNREVSDSEFRWVLEPYIQSRDVPADVVIIERTRHGNFYGRLVALIEDGQRHNGQSVTSQQVLMNMLQRTRALQKQAEEIQNKRIAGINYQLESLRLSQRKLAMKGQLTPAMEAHFAGQQAQLQQDYLKLEDALFQIRQQANRDEIQVTDRQGNVYTLPLSEVINVTYPNIMTLAQKFSYFFSHLVTFVSDNPREANTEGGVFPAIFGTVFMVLLMAVIVTPFGVIAAIYLHEYAHKGVITKVIRIAVVNLAGVPSIVYGVFGLGFLVYMVGGNIDRLFYSEALPSPTFGTPGVIWSAITLAILTLPVVIVSTEEGLSRIPSSMRDASMALGATRAETLWRVILPMASPAIMTGLILAIARAAGEVAPLMLVGVVKSAPVLPLDGNFPYVHLERKFMHLGFHIYDVGFQSPNIEAARPLVYATALLLVSVIVSLNITAIGIRNHLRNKYQALQY